MMEGIKALLGSEKALVGGSLVIAATVLVALGHMTVENWQVYTRDVFGLYIGGKTIQGAVSVWANTKKLPTPDEINPIIERIASIAKETAEASRPTPLPDPKGEAL